MSEWDIGVNLALIHGWGSLDMVRTPSKKAKKQAKKQAKHQEPFGFYQRKKGETHAAKKER